LAAVAVTTILVFLVVVERMAKNASGAKRRGAEVKKLFIAMMIFWFYMGSRLDEMMGRSVDSSHPH